MARCITMMHSLTVHCFWLALLALLLVLIALLLLTTLALPSTQSCWLGRKQDMETCAAL